MVQLSSKEGGGKLVLVEYLLRRRRCIKMKVRLELEH